MLSGHPPHFDTFDGQNWIRDAEGIECPSVGAAMEQAKSALPDLAHDELPDGAALKMMVRVRDEVGQVIGEATLDMNSVEFGGRS